MTSSLWVPAWSGWPPRWRYKSAGYQLLCSIAAHQVYWGKGYATEIGLAQLEYGFNVAGCKRLLAQVATKNAASKSTLEKIGMNPHLIVASPVRGTREIYIAERDE